MHYKMKSKLKDLALSLQSLSILLYFLLDMSTDNTLKYTLVIIVTAISGLWFVYTIVSLFKQSKQ